MIGCVILCHHQDPEPMLRATEAYGDNRVLVIDRSPEIVTSIECSAHVIHNDEGEGFLAGRMRNIGTTWLLENKTIDGIVYFDGDRIPNQCPAEFAQDCVLYRGSVGDARHELEGDITELCRHIYSPFYSAGFYLSARVLYTLGKAPFDADFDGAWGWEDSYLGDRIVSAGFSIHLPTDLRVSGELSEPEWMEGAELTDSRFRNWHLRLDKRKLLLGLIHTEPAATNKYVMLPQDKFEQFVKLLMALPYRDVSPIVEIINRYATVRVLPEK